MMEEVYMIIRWRSYFLFLSLTVHIVSEKLDLLFQHTLSTIVQLGRSKLRQRHIQNILISKFCKSLPVNVMWPR